MGCRKGSIRMSYLESPRVVQYLKAAGRPITDEEANKAVDGIHVPLLGNIVVSNFSFRNWINTMITTSCEQQPKLSGTIFIDGSSHIKCHRIFDEWLACPEGEELGRTVFAQMTSIPHTYDRYHAEQQHCQMHGLPKNVVRFIPEEHQ